MSKSIRNAVLGILSFVLVFMFSSLTVFAQDGELTLTAPVLTEKSHTASSVTLGWTDNSETTVDGYEILSYSKTNGEYTHLAEVGADVSSYTVNKLAAGNVYYYSLRSFVVLDETNEKVYSDYSNNLEAATTPAANKITSVTRGDASLTVSFTSVNCSSYQLRYSKKSDMSDAKTITVKNSVTKVKVPLTGATRYYVQMRSVVTLPERKTSVYSSWSNKVNELTKPQKMVISSTSTPSTTSIKASWKTVTATSYQLQYATKSNFSNKKTVTLSKSTKSKTISKLKKGTTYYVRIRAYVTYNGTKIYGSWSDVKKQKIYTTKKLTVSAKLMKSAKWSSTTLATVKKGKTVRYISTSGRWLKVIYDGKTGYIYNLGFKKAGSSNLSRSKVTAKNYQTYLDDIIFSVGKDKKKLFNYVVNHMSYSYSKISSAQKKANINSLDKVKKNEAELTAVAIKKQGGICYNFAALTKTLLQRAGFNVQYIFGANKNGTHCWVLIKSGNSYRHLDAVRNAYSFTDKQMKSSSKTKDFSWDKKDYPACV